MAIQKKDFVEMEYTGRVKDGDIFDSNIPEDVKKMNLNINPNPIIICIGENMILPSIDEFLIGKDIGNYTLDLPAEKAFGERKRELIRTVSLSLFKNQDRYPQPGMVFSFDNMLGKVTAVSGGRVIIDFNNPIAGKEVIYTIKIKRIIENQEEKVKSLILTYFGKEFTFKIENNKLIIEVEKKLVKLFEIFKPKFKEIFNLDLETSESKDSEGAQKFERTEKISDMKETENKEEENKQEEAKFNKESLQNENKKSNS